MSNDLFRLVHPVSEQGLVEALRDPHLLEVKQVDAEVDLSGFDTALEQLLSSDVRESAMDGVLVEPQGLYAWKGGQAVQVAITNAIAIKNQSIQRCEAFKRCK